MPLPEHAVILLAEDLENDVFLVRRAFAKAGVNNPLFIVRDGEECLAYLNGVGKYANRDEYPLPHILLLDIKMPKVDGFEVLKEIRKNKSLAPVRIIMLTSSQEVFDINKAYEMGANSFLVKPHEFENYADMMRTLSSFWLNQSNMPILKRPPKKKEGNGNGAHGNHTEPAGK
jgi:CheY-like chemotaxis protein